MFKKSDSMRKIILISGIALLMCKINYSQETQQEPKQETKQEIKFFRFGLKATPSIAWLKSKSSGFSGKGAEFGFIYGAMGDFFFTDNYAITTGIDANYNGGELRYNNNPETNGKFRLQYIEIPVSLKMMTKEYGYVSYYGQFGFSVSIRLNAKEDWSRTDTNVVQNVNAQSNEDIIRKVNLFRCSFLLAGGIEYSLRGTTRLIAGISFNNGLSHFFRKKYNDIKHGEFGDSNSVNNSLGLTFGIFF